MATDYVNGGIYNGPYSPSLGAMGVLSENGCPYRGTTVCHKCPFAEQVAAMCDYICYFCEHRDRCKCG